MITEKLSLPLVVIIMVMTTLATLTIVLGYQLVWMKNLTFSAVALIIPFRYLLSDIVAEVYGFRVAKNIIVTLILCSFLFSLLGTQIIKLPAPANWSHKEAYDFILGNALYITASASIGMLIGSTLNIYLVSKWKILMKGKYFWLRRFGSSVTGELTQYAIGLSIMFYHTLHWDKLFKLIFTDYSLQLVMLFLLSPIAHICMYSLKQLENIREDDLSVKIDVFKV